jgi:thioesterase domain-containing protein
MVTSPFSAYTVLVGASLAMASWLGYFGVEQSVYGLQARGMDGIEEPDQDVETMANRYIKAIRTVQPHGPYQLGGYCYGGVIAFEMARQLEANGEKTNLLAIFEGYAPLRGDKRVSIWRSPRLMLNFIHNMPYWFFDYWSLGRDQMWHRLRRKIQVYWKKIQIILGGSVTWGVTDVLDHNFHRDVPARKIQLMQAHIRAMSNYNPGIYTGPITLFRIRSQSLSRVPDPTLGWTKLAVGGVVVKRIAGSHHNILEQPHVQNLATALKESLIQD